MSTVPRSRESSDPASLPPSGRDVEVGDGADARPGTGGDDTGGEAGEPGPDIGPGGARQARGGAGDDPGGDPERDEPGLVPGVDEPHADDGDPDDESFATARPPARMLRFLKAYWVTFRVIASYLSVRFQARFRSPEAIARLLNRKHIRNAQRIERAIIQLQGLFIKVGQLISIMTNFLPDAFREQLEGLQDQVPPRPYSDIEARIREEFDGRGPDELFARFHRRPVASASIGQVHIAYLPGGEKVAVKVQYPDIEEVVKSDLRTLQRIFRIVGHFVHYAGLDEVYREIRAMILEELDFRREADNARRIAANFVDRSDVGFPRSIDELSTARVLTTHFEDGCKVSNLAALEAAGIDRHALARQVIELYCQQIFSDGLYHADPHPGNILVRTCARARTSREAGEGASDETGPGSLASVGAGDHGVCVVFLDFGAVAEVSPEMRQGLIELIQGGITGDTERIVAAMKQMGFISRGADDRVFDRVVEYFHARFQEEISLDSFNLADIRFDPEKSLENLADLRRMDISIRELTANFHVPKEWILLERTLLLLVGLCTALDPTMNPMSVIRPYLERFVLGEGDWSTLVVDTTKDLVLSVAALPGDMRKFMRTAQAGALSVSFGNLEQASNLVYRLGHQAILAAIGIAGAVIAIMLEGRGELERAEWAWWTARIAGAALVWSWWTSRNLIRSRH